MSRKLSLKHKKLHTGTYREDRERYFNLAKIGEEPRMVEIYSPSKHVYNNFTNILSYLQHLHSDEIFHDKNKHGNHISTNFTVYGPNDVDDYYPGNFYINPVTITRDSPTSKAHRGYETSTLMRSDRDSILDNLSKYFSGVNNRRLQDKLDKNLPLSPLS